jgi:hypothetical protein
MKLSILTSVCYAGLIFVASATKIEKKLLTKFLRVRKSIISTISFASVCSDERYLSESCTVAGYKIVRRFHGELVGYFLVRLDGLAFVESEGSQYVLPDVAVAFNSGCGIGLEMQSITYRVLDQLSGSVPVDLTHGARQNAFWSRKRL